ncbi:riboflavin biosynthesis protein RibF [Oenococcus sp.]|uniref:riboflavin biosynthesis protein RibF n=1 Tax=Oenococcus sp. TaxID=1979414 RepID=UPI0039ED51DC
MKVINLQFPNIYQSDQDHQFVLAVGYFDGLHLGHQAVIRRAQQIAEQRSLKLAVLTYRQSPASFYQDDASLKAPILPLPEKLKKFAEMQVDTVFLIDYSLAFGQQPAQTYVDHYLAKMGLAVLVAGFDHTYGSVKEKADMAHLPIYAKKRFEIVSVSEQDDADGKISSTRIRSLIQSGKVSDANRLLGYDYRTIGRVVLGNQIGRTLGFPTANQQLIEPQLLPKAAVYAVRVKILTGQFAGKMLNGMASIGHNVTFGDNNPMTVEINLFDFYGNIYDETIAVDWIDYVRDQQKFDSVRGLVDKLHEDQSVIKKILAANSPV